MMGYDAAGKIYISRKELVAFIRTHMFNDPGGFVQLDIENMKLLPNDHLVVDYAYSTECNPTPVWLKKEAK